MIAAFPMYDRPELAATWDHLWLLFCEAYGDGPRQLTRDRDVWDVWQSPDLLLAQTCGFPYRSRLKDKVALIGAPDHGIEEAPAGHYRSVIVASKRYEGAKLDTLHDATLAFNEPLSQSGWAAIWRHFEDNGFRIGPRQLSGAHRESARMVARGDADFAALDIISWKMMTRYDDFTSDLIVVDMTRPTPALPFISARYQDAARIQNALQDGLQSLTFGQREELFLHGLVHLPQSSYEAVPNPPSP
ncbi:phosphate/phosphite/phosphonate ABC transporter substrate-binding protein [Shimia sagamensis]|uniref:ABC transporter, phosphonate, substrate-binding protein n=1 Tax=Shimia sagamensis TaxID=1566352 RepID=A0ABY1NM86_9RHOB|nr:PhnD/SsuA/transferrin family substrate-binding protein [Shimia sagamensis]SMP12721.1 ABC transporter, phosphonate, substrate-binding protein [Shimia sagamensis]